MSADGHFRLDGNRVVHETIDGETIAIDLTSGTYFSFTGSGPAIWAALVAGVPETAVLAAVAAAQPDAAEAAASFIAELVGEHLLEPADGAPAETVATVELPDGAGPPRLERYADMEHLLLLDPIHEVQAAGWPRGGTHLARPGTDRRVTVAPAPRVSVVVAVRNGERYLGEALDSLLEQSPPVDEVVVVDDGSEDGSAALAAAAGDRVRCVSQPPRGIGAARNHGLTEARGGLVGVLDADDRWAPGAVAAWLDAFSAAPERELVLGQLRHFISPDVEPELRERLICPPDAAPSFMPGGWLARRDAVDRVGAFREDIVSGDMIDWLIRAGEAGLHQHVMPEQVMWRRLHADNHGRHQRAARSDYARVLKAALDRRRAADGPPEEP